MSTLSALSTQAQAVAEAKDDRIKELRHALTAAKEEGVSSGGQAAALANDKALVRAMICIRCLCATCAQGPASMLALLRRALRLQALYIIFGVYLTATISIPK